MKNKTINNDFFQFKLIWCLFLYYIFSSCSSLGRYAYGIKKPKVIPLNKIEQKYLKSNLPKIAYDKIGVLDSLFYDSIVKNNHNYTNKAFIQPLVAMYFDSSNKHISTLLNCYAWTEGFNLAWNDSGRLSSFPPKTHTQLYDSVDLNSIVQHLLITNSKNTEAMGKFTVVIFWNFFMNRQTRIFLESMKYNLDIAKARGLNYVVYFINNDNMYNVYTPNF